MVYSSSGEPPYVRARARSAAISRYSVAKRDTFASPSDSSPFARAWSSSFWYSLHSARCRRTSAVACAVPERPPAPDALRRAISSSWTMAR